MPLPRRRAVAASGPMNVAIIGAGNVGSALGGSLTKAGHSILYGVRKPDGGAMRPIVDAVRASDVIILATPWKAMADVAASLGDVRGKTIIDCTNPLALTPEGSLGLAVGFTTSGAEELQNLLPTARVVKMFNTYGWENFADASYPGYGGAKPVMFHCGDDDDAKAAAAKLAADIGFEPFDVGGLGMARTLEPLALMWIRLAISGGRNPHFTWAVLRRDAPGKL